MTEPASHKPDSPPKQTDSKSSFTWSIGVTSVLVLLLVVLAIGIPEYLKYRFQMKMIEVQTKQIDYQQELDRKKIETLNAATSPAPPQTSAVKTDPTSQPALKPASDPSGQASIATAGSRITPGGVDSSLLFESYGRFITLLVGLLSVLGLFFGFFVRKSVHEMEEKMETKIEKILSDWKEEKTEIKQSYKDQSDQLNTKLNEVGSLKAEVEDLKIRLTEYLDDYDKSKQKYAEGPTRPAEDPESVADEL